MRRAWAALVLTLAPGLAAAAMRCDVTVLPFVFGLYAPGDPVPLDVTGSVDVRCVGTPGTFFATLSPGTSGSFAQRYMLSGASRMNYNLYVNPGRTLIWGDGTGGSLPIGRNKVRSGRDDFSLPIYGRVPPGQSVGAGAYADDVIVTVVF